jgi:hypothetical protein
MSIYCFHRFIISVQIVEIWHPLRV